MLTDMPDEDNAASAKRKEMWLNQKHARIYVAVDEFPNKFCVIVYIRSTLLLFIIEDAD